MKFLIDGRSDTMIGFDLSRDRLPTMTKDRSGRLPPEKDAVGLAVQLLAKELRRRLQRHPAAHLLNGRESVELRMRLPTVDQGDWVAETRQITSKSLDDALGRLLLHRSVFRTGRVYCLRCASPECEHSVPTFSTEVFAGYSPSGIPKFQDLGQWLLERRDPKVDHLYRTPSGLVAHLATGAELLEHLLPAFRDADSGYHIHGQVAVGWYMFPTEDGLSSPVALSFQVVSTRPEKGRRRYGLNLIGVGPDDEPLENLFDRIGEIPWLDATRWAQSILRDVERSAARQSRPSDEQTEKRLTGMLTGLARRLEHQRRSRDRKTQHGQKRHRDRSRPTDMAIADLDQARDSNILVDTRRQTLVVLGDRGRAHVFNPSGRLVTSIRYSPAAIEKRRKRGLWKAASRDQIGALKKQVTLIQEGDEG